MSRDISNPGITPGAIQLVNHLLRLSHQSITRATDLISNFPVEMLTEHNPSFDHLITHHVRALEQIEGRIRTWSIISMTYQEQMSELSSVTADLFEIKSTADQVSSFYEHCMAQQRGASGSS